MAAQSTKTSSGAVRVGASDGGFDSAFSGRVRLYLKSTFLINMLFFVLAFSILLSGGDEDFNADDPRPIIAVGVVTAINGLAWFLVSIRKQTFWSSVLTAASVTLILCASYAYVTLNLPEDINPSRTAVFATALCGIILVLRSSVVPSPTFATIIVGFLCMAFPIYMGRPEVVGSGWVPFYWQIALALVFIIITAVTSQTVYGLERRMSAATRLGQYQLEQVLGRGGMGEVYLAKHALLQRPTAIKLLRDASASSTRDHFRREVQTASGLSHPNTVEIYDYGRTSEGVFYFAMEYVEGATLDAIVRTTGAMPPARVAHLLAQAAGALGEAHERGLVHRDVKPSNLMLCERGGVFDTLKVLDFGLVRDLSEPSSEGESSVLAGTPLYMAPETILKGDGFVPQSDVYALSATGYFLLTGHAPFEHESLVEVLSDHLATTPARPDCNDRALVDLLLLGLSKEPLDRPADARAFRDALLSCASFGQWQERDASIWWAEHHEVVASAHRDGNSTRDGEPGSRTKGLC